MHLSHDQLVRLNGHFVVPPPDPVMERLERLERLIADLPKPPKPEKVDLAPVIQRLDDLEAAVENIPVPAAADLQPLMTRLAKLEKAVAAIPPRPASYTFDVKRDDNGKMTKVVASRTNSKSMIAGT